MFAQTLNIQQHIEYAVKSFFINRGVEAQAVYLGDLQWKLLEDYYNVTLQDDLEQEACGVPCYHVHCPSHLRVS